MLRGGNRFIPINLQESIKRKTTILDNNNAYEPRLPTYWRFDYGMAYKINKERTTWTFRIDLQNATVRKIKSESDLTIKRCRFTTIMRYLLYPF